MGIICCTLILYIVYTHTHGDGFSVQTSRSLIQTFITASDFTEHTDHNSFTNKKLTVQPQWHQSYSSSCKLNGSSTTRGQKHSRAPSTEFLSHVSAWAHLSSLSPTPLSPNGPDYEVTSCPQSSNARKLSSPFSLIAFASPTASQDDKHFCLPRILQPTKPLTNFSGHVLTSEEIAYLWQRCPGA